jgi:SAM-dependent methyltransferase
MSVQETQGVLSPALRDIRLRKIAQQIEPGATILDLGCGAGYLGSFLPAGCTYVGIDRVQPPRMDRFSDFLQLDLNAPGAVEAAHDWLPIRPRYLTCAAAMEHFDAPAELIKGFGALIETGGRLVATTAHPRGERIHAYLASVRLCSKDAATEHHRFLDYGRIRQLAAVSGGTLVKYQLFLLRLNQLFVVQY